MLPEVTDRCYLELQTCVTWSNRQVLPGVRQVLPEVTDRCYMKLQTGIT